MATKSKKVKKVVIEFDEGAADEGSNPLVFVPGAKKRRATDDGPLPKKKDPTGGKKNKNVAKEKEKEKVTKKMKRQLKQVQQRKAKKITQAELFESLAEYQLDAKKLQHLGSTAHMQDKDKKKLIDGDVDAQFPEKLKGFSGKIKQAATIHQKERKQENYYPTDDETSDEDEEDVAEVAEEGTSADSAVNNSVTKEESDTSDDDEDRGVPMESETIEAEVAMEEETGTLPADRKRNARSKIKFTASEEEDLPKSKKSQKKVVEQTNGDKEVKEEPADDVAAPLPKSRQHVLVNRDPEIEAKRAELPIYAEELPILEAISENIVTVLCGETGSGKTTQVPQFLLEAGYANDGQLIGITEPRRVAAISMAQRVGEELGMKDEVSYQIRYEGTRSDKTKILFMTDGVLMKEMESDVMLKKYSAIMIDEAHERSMYSDVLIGMLSRIAPLRAKTDNPLKLIIMSATLRLEDFLHERLFPSIEPKVIKVDSRQFPVTVHFEKRTPDDYLKAVFRKTVKIHETLPNGTILIFVSGQQEAKLLIKQLSTRYPIQYAKTKDGETVVKGSKKWKQKMTEEAKNLKLEDFEEIDPKEKAIIDALDGEDLLESGVGGEAWDDYDEEFTDEANPNAELAPPPTDATPLYCLPLYSLLSTEKQRRVFEPAPEGTRMCVIATNVAETSLTIPGVRYVVDTGYEKRRLYDPITGVSQFVVAQISQASADQRAGRAGRISAGHAYRLYSSAVFQDLEKFSRPEILDKPADQLVLHLKSMNIVKVVNFPFPSAPDADVMEAAESRLIKMGALATTTRDGKTEARITPLGKTLSVFPLAPAYAKVIAMSNQQGLMPYAIALIAALSVREPLVPIHSLRGSTDDETKAMMTTILKLRRGWCGMGPSRRLGDLLVLLRAVTASEEEKMDTAALGRLGLRAKAMLEIRRLRQQLTNIVNTSFKAAEDVTMDPAMPPPTDAQAQMLRQMMVAGLSDRIARRVDRAMGDEEVPRGAYQTMKLREHVFIDPCSVIYTEEPDYVIYQDIVQLGDKKCMQCVMSVDHEWLPRLAESYCNYGQMDSEVEPKWCPVKDDMVKSVSVSFGPLEWPLDAVDRPIRRDIMLYRHFARCLLNGEVAPQMAEYVPKLLAPPNTMVRSWARLQQRTEGLLNRLIAKDTCSRASLISAWQSDENYLLEEYLEWLPESLHSTVTMMWPPLEEEHKTHKMGRNKKYVSDVGRP